MEGKMAESVCASCGGSGWKIVEREGLSGAERCACSLPERVRNLAAGAGIPPLYSGSSLDNFLLPQESRRSNDALGAVVNQVRKYAREFPFGTEKPGLLFLGEPGSGKTHLAVAALRILISRGFEGVFFDYQNLLERIRSGYDPNAGASDREAYRSALDCEVLLLDDLGAHRVLEWIEDTVTAIVTYRCNHRKALIATTNLPDTGAGDNLVERTPGGTPLYKVSLADRIGERARSRLFEMCKVIRMPAVGDYRLRKPRA
jgi:DNA replication protein DnaC